MKKDKIIIVTTTLFVLSIGTFLVMNFLCELGVKCKNCTQTSNTKKQSKQNGFYITDYKPLEQVVQLKNHDERITFNKVWIESQWYYNSNNCLFKKLKVKSGYNVIFEFEKSNKESFLFGLSPVINGKIDMANGRIMESKKVVRLHELTDTLWLQIREKNPKQGSGWNEPLEGELIGFIKSDWLK